MIFASLRRVAALLSLLLVFVGFVSVPSSANAYDTSLHAYDAAANSVQAHTSEAALVASDEVSEGVQEGVSAAAGPLSVVFAKSVAANTGAAEADWANVSGIVRDAAKGKGDFGVGSGTVADAESAGWAWVGEDARVSSDGFGWVSRDGMRMWRPPSFKPNYKGGIWQSNFESKYPGISDWQTNGHLDITDLP